MDKKKITENWIKYKTKQMAESNLVPYSSICGCTVCGCTQRDKMVEQPILTPPTLQSPLEEFNEYLRLLADMKTVGLKRKKKLLADYLNNL